MGEEVEGAQRGAGVRQQFVLQLDEVVAAEDAVEDGGRGAGAGLVAGEQPRPDLAAAAAAERDEVAAVLGEGGEPGHGRLARVLEVGGADDAAEVAPAGVVAGEEHQVVAAGAGGAGGGGRHRGRRLEVRDAAVGGERRRGRRGGDDGRIAAGRIRRVRAAVRARLPDPAARADRRLDRELDADDGLDAGRLARLVEADGAVQPLVVGDRQGRHAELGGAHDQLGDAAGAVAERERGVRMQMDEGHGILPKSAGMGLMLGFPAIVILFVIWVGLVVLTAWLAAKKGYGPALWTIIAIFFPLIAFIVVLVLPRRSQAACSGLN